MIGGSVVGASGRTQNKICESKTKKKTIESKFLFGYVSVYNLNILQAPALFQKKILNTPLNEDYIAKFTGSKVPLWRDKGNPFWLRKL